MHEGSQSDQGHLSTSALCRANVILVAPFLAMKSLVHRNILSERGKGMVSCKPARPEAGSSSAFLIRPVMLISIKIEWQALAKNGFCFF